MLESWKPRQRREDSDNGYVDSGKVWQRFNGIPAIIVLCWKPSFDLADYNVDIIDRIAKIGCINIYLIRDLFQTDKWLFAQNLCVCVS